MAQGTKHINFVVETELWTEIHNTADARGLTVSEVLREILRIHFAGGDRDASVDSAALEAHRAAYATSMRALNEAYHKTVGQQERVYQERLAARKARLGNGG